jgi:hypothetical protein
VALAWQSYEEDVAAAAEATEKLAEEQERLNSAMEGVKSLAAASASEIEKLAVANGRLTKEQYDANEMARSWSASLAQARAPLEELRAELLANNDASSEHAAKLVDVEQKLRDANEAAAAGYEAAKLNAEIAREQAESEEVLATRIKNRERAERGATKATKEATTELEYKQQTLEDLIEEEDRWAARERGNTENANQNARARVDQDQAILANKKAGRAEMEEMWEEDRQAQLGAVNDVANGAADVAEAAGRGTEALAR